MRRLGWLLLLPLPAAIWATQVRIDERAGGREAHAEALVVWSGETIARMWPGLEAVMADLYWLRAVQYYGGQRAFNPGSRFELLEPLIEITVTLDPRFLLAYRYGAIFLAETWPTGAGRPEAAVALLERGIAENPESWELHWDLGYLRYLFLHDAAGGAEVLMAGAERPGAPVWLRTLAGRILAGARQRDTARMIWRQIYEQNDGPIRDNALANLQYLDAQDVMDAYRERIARFHEQTRRYPDRLLEVRRFGGPPLPLVDPTGVAFRYDAQTGRVGLSRQSSLWTLQPREERQ